MNYEKRQNGPSIISLLLSQKIHHKQQTKNRERKEKGEEGE
jgi:hypothetical protein